jgi:hypothetical protein
MKYLILVVFFLLTEFSFCQNSSPIRPAVEVGFGTNSLTHANNEIENKISGGFEHDSFDIAANIGFGVIFPLNSYKIIMSSTFHSSIFSVFESQQNDLSKYITLKIGVLINQ